MAYFHPGEQGWLNLAALTSNRGFKYCHPWVVYRSIQWTVCHWTARVLRRDRGPIFQPIQIYRDPPADHGTACATQLEAAITVSARDTSALQATSPRVYSFHSPELPRLPAPSFSSDGQRREANQSREGLVDFEELRPSRACCRFSQFERAVRWKDPVVVTEPLAASTRRGTDKSRIHPVFGLQPGSEHRCRGKETQRPPRAVGEYLRIRPGTNVSTDAGVNSPSHKTSISTSVYTDIRQGPNLNHTRPSQSPFLWPPAIETAVYSASSCMGNKPTVDMPSSREPSMSTLPAALQTRPYLRYTTRPFPRARHGPGAGDYGPIWNGPISGQLSTRATKQTDLCSARCIRARFQASCGRLGAPKDFDGSFPAGGRPTLLRRPVHPMPDDLMARDDSKDVPVYLSAQTWRREQTIPSVVTSASKTTGAALNGRPVKLLCIELVVSFWLHAAATFVSSVPSDFVWQASQRLAVARACSDASGVGIRHASGLFRMLSTSLGSEGQFNAVLTA
ncbi:hypothetical protein DFH06DRAFT_1120516 [Mycena polygramma]|nr:hypothetical protein DFH06DRAFT_1120516 [Mycena polygramma]